MLRSTFVFALLALSQLSFASSTTKTPVRALAEGNLICKMALVAKISGSEPAKKEEFEAVFNQEDQTIDVFQSRTSSEKVISRISVPYGERILKTSLSPNGSKYLLVFSNKSTRLYRVRDRAMIYDLQLQPDSSSHRTLKNTTTIAWSTDGTKLLSTYSVRGQSVIYLLDLNNLNGKDQLLSRTGSSIRDMFYKLPNDAAWSADGKRLLILRERYFPSIKGTNLVHKFFAEIFSADGELLQEIKGTYDEIQVLFNSDFSS